MKIQRVGAAILAAVLAAGVGVAGAGASSVPSDDAAAGRASRVAAMRAAVTEHPELRSIGTAQTPLRPVPAAVQTITDPTGDAGWPQADIIGAGLEMAANGLTAVGIKVDTYESPFSTNWRDGDTAALWDVDVDADGLMDYYLGIVNVGGSVGAVVLDSNDNVVCGADVAFDPVGRWYYAVIDTSCIGAPASANWRAVVLYEDVMTASTSADVAPDSAWAGPVANDAEPSPAGASFSSLVPGRLMDSRAGGSSVDGQFAGVGVRGVGSVTELLVAGRGGVPGDAAAVALNVTVAGAQGGGFVTVWPCGAAMPNASNLNFSVGDTVPNAVIAKVGAGGRVCLFTSAATDLIVDVNGFFPAVTG